MITDRPPFLYIPQKWQTSLKKMEKLSLQKKMCHNIIQIKTLTSQQQRSVLMKETRHIICAWMLALTENTKADVIFLALQV